VAGGELDAVSEGDALKATFANVLQDASIVDPNDPRDFASRYHTAGGKSFLKTSFR
jgi:hypothetical protein